MSKCRYDLLEDCNNTDDKKIPHAGFLIQRVNLSFGRDITIIGQRSMCGENAMPFERKSSALAALKRQEKQDMEYCPECVIIYNIIKTQGVPS